MVGHEWRMALTTLAALSALASGCWADFPDSRLKFDGTLPGDSNVLPGDGKLPPGDAALPPDSTVPINCTPNEFLDCTGLLLERCNAAGNAKEFVNCGNDGCSTAEKRCNQCTPGAGGVCDGTSLSICSEWGLKELQPCTLGCENDACCVDADKDGYSNCTANCNSCKDCNDQEAKIHPGAEFGETAIDGSFDFDCDGVVTKEFTANVQCVGKGPKCEGDGWATGAPIPDCGQPGQFRSCVRAGAECVPGAVSTVAQRCR